MRILPFFLVLFLNSNYLFSQMYSPVSWTFETEKISDTEYVLVSHASVDNGWVIYSQFISDEGPVPTTFTYDDASIQKVGKNEEVGKSKKMYDSMFGMELIKLYGNIDFRQKVKVSKSQKHIKGYVTFMTCDDEKCLPPVDVDFDFVLE